MLNTIDVEIELKKITRCCNSIITGKGRRVLLGPNGKHDRINGCASEEVVRWSVKIELIGY